MGRTCIRIAAWTATGPTSMGRAKFKRAAAKRAAAEVAIAEDAVAMQHRILHEGEKKHARGFVCASAAVCARAAVRPCSIGCPKHKLMRNRAGAIHVRLRVSQLVQE